MVYSPYTRELLESDHDNYLLSLGDEALHSYNSFLSGLVML